MPHKYRAINCRQRYPECEQGHASLKEHRRAQELRLLERAGEIRGLREQVRVPLCDHDKPRVWVADFVYWERCDGREDEWQEVYEDVKGGKATQTEAFRLKLHILTEHQGIEVRLT